MSDLDAERCYRAVASRDARFDGRFFTGVTTTGIYCRPVCPSRTPRRENARFFRSAAEAEGEGFRPCLRCRPETAPGSPAWKGTRTSIAQALRLVSAGYLDGHSVDELSGRLGMGPRHLRRLFHRHLGATPVHVAQVRRLHFARSLLADTALPVSEVAFASGFGSLRQFNDLFHRVYGLAPTGLRRSVPAAAGRAGTLDLRLRYRPPYPWESVLGFLARRAVPGVEEVRDGVYRRAVAVGGTAGLIEVAPLEGEHVLRLRVIAPVSRELIRVVERVRRLFDLDSDPDEIGRHLGADARLAPLLSQLPGVRVPGAWDGFELAVRAVVGQQVSVAAATRFMGGLAERYGEPLAAAAAAGGNPAGSPGRLFPTPARLAAAVPGELRLPGQRARALLGLARAVRDGEIVLDGSVDVELVRRRLTAIPGIGEWTAQYIAMRALADPDAFPAADLGLLKAAAWGGERPGAVELLRQAEAWRPWRAYAAMLLWNSGG